MQNVYKMKEKMGNVNKEMRKNLRKNQKKREFKKQTL